MLRVALVVVFVSGINSNVFSAKLRKEKRVQDDLKILVYDETSGYTHTSRDAARTMFQNLGDDMGFGVDFDRTGDAFNSLENLQGYAIVVFSNTSGNEILNQTQKDNFESYIKSGGSFLGIHAATDTYRSGWNWYRDLVGGSVRLDPNHTTQNFPGTMDVLDKDHPSTKNVPDPWSRNEEWYYWKGGGGYLYEHNINLLQLRATGDEVYDEVRPVSWYKEYDGGKSFYTAMGHDDGTYREESFVAHISGAIEWLLFPSGSPGESIPPSFDQIPDPQPLVNNSEAITIEITGIDPGSGSIENIKIVATSSDPEVIPHPEITYTQGENAATLSFQPVPDAQGSADIMVTITNEETENNKTEQTFTVTVVLEEIVLEVSEIANQLVDGAQGLNAISFNVYYESEEYEKLTIIATSDNQELIPDDQISIEGEEGEYELHLEATKGKTGTTLITLKVSDGKQEKEQTFEVEVLPVTAVEGDFREGTVQVFPNPTNDFVQFKLPTGHYKAMLLNKAGACVKSWYLTAKDQKINQIKLTDFPSGTYMIKIVSDRHQITSRIIIK